VRRTTSFNNLRPMIMYRMKKVPDDIFLYTGTSVPAVTKTILLSPAIE